MPRHSPERQTDGAPPASSGSVLDLELEDEKENDRHRRRTQQSRDDPGAKACEAMCVLCVGLLFVQVAFIVYSNGLDGTIKLLMAPEQPLKQVPRVRSYRVSGAAPDGYSDAVTVAYNAARGVQVIHFTVAGMPRVVVQDAQARTTQWLAFTGTTSQASCLLLSNDSSLAYGVLPPRETFGQHASFAVLEPGSAAAGEALALKLAQDTGADAASCAPFMRRGAAGLEWTAAPWPSSVAHPARAPSDAVQPQHGSWCGHQRGGLHACCSGAACAACTSLGATTNDACLAACPPQDALDAACAAHALCAHRAGGVVSQGTCASARQGAAPCDCDTALAAAVEETGGCGGKCEKAQGAVAAWVKDRACWRPMVACQHVPCTSGPGGWCKECAHFKTCDAMSR
jgi:hypothetical protein